MFTLERINCKLKLIKRNLDKPSWAPPTPYISNCRCAPLAIWWCAVAKFYVKGAVQPSMTPRLKTVIVYRDNALGALLITCFWQYHFHRPHAMVDKLSTCAHNSQCHNDFAFSYFSWFVKLKYIKAGGWIQIPTSILWSIVSLRFTLLRGLNLK